MTEPVWARVKAKDHPFYALCEASGGYYRSRDMVSQYYVTDQGDWPLLRLYITASHSAGRYGRHRLRIGSWFKSDPDDYVSDAYGIPPQLVGDLAKMIDEWIDATKKMSSQAEG